LRIANLLSGLRPRSACCSQDAADSSVILNYFYGIDAAAQFDRFKKLSGKLFFSRIKRRPNFVDALLVWLFGDANDKLLAARIFPH
jgi:hypothetical protein